MGPRRIISMRRREFLAASAAAAGASALPPFVGARAQAPPQPVTRSWLVPPNRYELSFDGFALTCDCLPQDAPAPDHVPSSAAAMVRLGGRLEPVAWELAAWHQLDPFTHILLLQAKDHPLQADIGLTIDRASGVLARHTLLRHHGDAAEIDIRATVGFWFGIHEPVERIFNLTGSWAEETQFRRARPDEAGLLLESRAGKTGFAFQPYAALRAGDATYLCQLLWSGNWMMHIQPDEEGATLSGGLHNWHFRHRLRPGASLALPTVLFGRFEGDLDRATQALHDYRRATRPDPDRAIPVQFNSWYPFLGEPNAAAVTKILPSVQSLGCEAFVVDAGWYRTDEGDSDEHWDFRTGDWRVSRSRFPEGLRVISENCHALGLQFGLWFEPEVIAPLSSIRTRHPEWLHHPGGRPPAQDERAVLNLGVPAAWQHVFGRVTRILRTASVDWMKWDFNAEIGPGGWAPGLPRHLTGQAPLVAHYEGLYRLQDAIRAAFPGLVLEMCASGGGRMDGEILSHAHVNWISDQIGPFQQLAIHFGAQRAHPAIVCNGWVIDWPEGSASYDLQTPFHEPRGDLALRLRVAMLGTFGISARLELWSEEDMALAAAHVALYRTRLRAIIQRGDQYLLSRAPPADGEGDWAAIWYAEKNRTEGVLFAFRLAGSEEERPFLLPGLAPDRRYRLSRFGAPPIETSGAALAQGFTLRIAETYRSELCLVEAVWPPD
jgi:alpha-galactosidase